MKYFLIFFLVVAIFFYDFKILKAAMSSPNYTIQSDAVDIGGARGSTNNFSSEDTLSEIATGESESPSYSLKAGYQSMQEVYLSLSNPSDVVVNPSIPGVSGGAGNGEVSWTTTTDDLAGYSLYIRSSASPALVSTSNPAAYFDDYTPAAANPDYDWQVDADKSEFGFTPEGADIILKFRDNGSVCDIGTFDTPDVCWYGFSSADPGELIAKSSSSNHPSGIVTNVKVQAQSNGSHIQEEGTYQATITVTALAN
jgi:hypothetical protein